MISVQPGDCFHLETNSDFQGFIQSHFTIIVLSVYWDESTFFIVPIDTCRGKYDDTCVLPAGCHKFIKKRSYVNYRETRIVEAQKIIDDINNGNAQKMDPIDPEILDKVRRGIGSSGFTPRGIKENYFESCW